MREFFKGWRRKAGVVTLVVACAAATGWVRSLRTMDELTIPGNRATHYLNSTDGTVGWWMRNDDPNVRFSFQTRRSDSNDWAIVLEQVHILWKFEWCGFGCGESHRSRLRIWMIPYWSIVLPLTLLSAYLLLSKRLPVKRREAAPAEGSVS